MNNNKSNSYDWFKGNNNQNNNKINFKFIWKITRIILYLALFVFTMTGCVQSFVISTNNKIGNGVEFYTSEKNISPHVTKFQLNTEKVGDSQNPIDIYNLSIDPKKPVWINDDTRIKTSNWWIK